VTHTNRSVQNRPSFLPSTSSQSGHFVQMPGYRPLVITDYSDVRGNQHPSRGVIGEESLSSSVPLPPIFSHSIILSFTFDDDDHDDDEMPLSLSYEIETELEVFALLDEGLRGPSWKLDDAADFALRQQLPHNSLMGN